jgi:glycosyltransferase involved in cell wall biosynthesis
VGTSEAVATDLLVVAPTIPEFDKTSGDLRLYRLLQIMARQYRVMILGHSHAQDPEAPRYIAALEEAGIEVHVAPQVDVSHVLHRVGLCVLFEFFTTAEGTLERVRMLRPDLPIVVDSVDVHFVRERRGARYASRPWIATLKAWRTRRRELRVYRRADLILTVTGNDRAEILRELPDARVAVIPNIHGVRNTVPDFEHRKRHSLLFVGGFLHRPNVDAVLFFCRDILPLVRRALPDVKVAIVGGWPPREIMELQHDGVAITGWVPDIVPYLDSHCAAIAPLRFGAGMKGKVGEALAAGLPMVTTSVGAEGMGLEHGRTALIADSPEGFADAVVQVCTDPVLHRRLSEEGRAHVRQRWAPDSIEKDVIQAIESIREVPPRPASIKDRLVGTAQGAYARSGLAQRLERAGSVTAWYAHRVSRILGKK